ncbi:MAG: O-antigen ligase family protein, partial [Conexibacter sp.]
MSSVIATPPSPDARRTASERAGIVSGVPRRRTIPHPDALVAVSLAALLLAIAFLARSGSVLSRSTAVEIALTLLGAGAVAVAILARQPRPRGVPHARAWGGVTLLLFGALAAWTALSIAWSVQPSDSWQAANLTLSYLALFAGTIALVHVAPARWSGVLGGVVLAAVVLCGWSLLVKAFPSISSLDLYARLRAPFDYWNAVGLMAALGIPSCLWLGARRDGHAALSALAVPALGLLLVALLLSYGRGPLLAAFVSVACWFALVPLRLRGAAVLATAGVGTAVVCAWAFSNDALTKDGTPLDVRADAGHSLALLLLALLVVLLLAGLALSFAMSRGALSPQGRRSLGTALLVALALIPLAGIAALAASDRGLTGSISHGWHQLTDPNAQQPANDPGRLASVGSVRARYWDNGFAIWRKAPWLGVGADGYATAREPIQPDRLRVRHAHGYVPQTLADLGLVGMGIGVALLVAWLLAAWRVARPRQAASAEQIGLTTLATTAVAFGVHSTVDWTWFVPGTAVTGLLCAAWVAGRGPLEQRAAAPALPRGRTA